MEIFLCSALFRATVFSSYFSLLCVSFQHFFQSPLCFPPTWISDTILQELMRAKKWVQLKLAALNSWRIFQHFLWGIWRKRRMELEGKVLPELWTQGQETCSGLKGTLMPLKILSTLSTWIKNSGQFSPWIKSSTFQHFRGYYSKSQKYREIVYTSFIYVSAKKYL